LHSIGIQSCKDYVDIQQVGDDQLSQGQVTIVPRLSFTCNGRINNIRVRLRFDDDFNQYPYIQLWRPSSPSSTAYNKIGEIQLQETHVELHLISGAERRIADIPLSGTNRLLVQSGDIVGFYHPPDSRYQIKTIQTAGYVLYSFCGSNTVTSLDSSIIVLPTIDKRQPLIQFTLGE